MGGTSVEPCGTPHEISSLEESHPEKRIVSYQIEMILSGRWFYLKNHNNIIE